MKTVRVPFALHEYASAMSGEHGIRIVEDPEAVTASVNLATRVIRLPALDYTKPITTEALRTRKAFLDHEIAHVLFTNPKYTDGLGAYPAHLRRLMNMIEDIRIERLHAAGYSGIREDLDRLNHEILASKLDESIKKDSIQSMMSLIFARGFTVPLPRGVSFNEKTKDSYHRCIQAELEAFISSDGTEIEEAAERIYHTLLSLYGNPTELSSEALDNKALSQESEGSPVHSHRFVPDSSTLSADHSDSEQPIEHSTDTSAHLESSPADTPPEPRSITEDGALSSEAIEQQIEAVCAALDREDYLSAKLDHTPIGRSSAGVIRPYTTHVVELSLTDIASVTPELSRKTRATQAAAIAAWRAVFTTALLSRRADRTLSAYHGRFDSRKAARLVSSTEPRAFTRTVEAARSSADILILLDCSGSMERPSRDVTRFEVATAAMVVLAEALGGLPQVDLEVAAYSADYRYNGDLGGVTSCPGDNVIYPLKRFDSKNTTVLSSFYEFALRRDLLAENFDYAAVQWASLRLRARRTAKRKLLIVISDGTPACRNNSSVDLLSSYVREVAAYHDVLGIGIQNSSIDTIYPRSVNVTDLVQFSTTVLASVRTYLCAADRPARTAPTFTVK